MKINNIYKFLNKGQLRVLSRIMTVILENVLTHSSVAPLIVTLQEVSEIITAPKLSRYEIEITMNELIQSYLEQRINAIAEFGMGRVRPKHHMLSHYSECYLNYGPLIGMWSLRMESKHTYFKAGILVMLFGIILSPLFSGGYKGQSELQESIQNLCDST